MTPPHYNRIIVIIIFEIILLCCVVVFLYQMPGAQLVDQSIANLSLVVEQYIRLRGTMPSGFADLEKAGLIIKGPGGLYETTAAPHTLYRLNSIHVAWELDTTKVIDHAQRAWP